MGQAPLSDWFDAFPSVLVDSLEGLHSSFDDFLIVRKTLEELDVRMRQFIKRCKSHSVKLST